MRSTAKLAPMNAPVDISFRNCSPSLEIRSEIEREILRLHSECPQVTSYDIAVTTPTLLHHREGQTFRISIRLTLPQQKDIIVSRTRDDVHQHEHISAAIADAFAAAFHEVKGPTMAHASAEGRHPEGGAAYE